MNDEARFMTPEEWAGLVRQSAEEALKRRDIAEPMGMIAEPGDTSDTARILRFYHRMVHLERLIVEGSEETAKRLDFAFLLGADFLELQRDRMLSDKNRERASAPRKKQWAIDLARDLADRFEGFPKAWKSIPKDGMKIYRSTDESGAKVVCYSDATAGDDHLRRESFRTGYFKPPEFRE